MQDLKHWSKAQGKTSEVKMLKCVTINVQGNSGGQSPIIQKVKMHCQYLPL